MTTRISTLRHELAAIASLKVVIKNSTEYLTTLRTHLQAALSIVNAKLIALTSSPAEQQTTGLVPSAAFTSLTPGETGISWLERVPYFCMKVDGKFTGVDCALEDLVENAGCADYWRGQLKDKATALNLDVAAVFASLDTALKGYGIEDKSDIAYVIPEDEDAVRRDAPSANTTFPVVALEWILDGLDLKLLNGDVVLYRLPAMEAYPIGPETIELLETMRSTPYFNANVIVHLLAFLVEHDMVLQEAIDAAYNDQQAAGAKAA